MRLVEHGRWPCRVLAPADVCHAWLDDCIAVLIGSNRPAEVRPFQLMDKGRVSASCHCEWRRPSLVVPYVTEKPLPSSLPAATLNTSSSASVSVSLSMTRSPLPSSAVTSTGGSTLPVQAGTASELDPSSVFLQDYLVYALAGTDGMHGDQCQGVPEGRKRCSHAAEQASA